MRITTNKSPRVLTRKPTTSTILPLSSSSHPTSTNKFRSTNTLVHHIPWVHRIRLTTKPRRFLIALVFGLLGLLACRAIFGTRTGARTTNHDEHDDENACFKRPWVERCLIPPWLSTQGPGAEGEGKGDPFAEIHYTRKSGHLFWPGTSSSSAQEGEIPPNQPHPIHQLIHNAKKLWADKVRRQSTTLEAAVQEYGRRYGMPPPPGFEGWWEFAREKNFLMVDEFDSMMKRLRPYLSLPPELLRARSERLMNDPELWLYDKMFTIKIRHSPSQPLMHAEGPMRNDVNERSIQMLQLLGGIAKFLPEMNITFTGHDVPWIALSGEARQMMNEAVDQGRYVDPSTFEDSFDTPTLDGWAAICDPSSPIRTMGPFKDRMDTWKEPEGVGKVGGSFIEDHLASMDFCRHPERQGLHGYTAWEGPRPNILFPVFSFTSTSVSSDFLATPIDQYDVEQGEDPVWENKTMNKAIWRGSTTGARLDIPNMRKWSQRPRLCLLYRQPGTITLPYSPLDTPSTLGPMSAFTTRLTMLAYRYFDFKFIGEPEQCDDPTACEEFKALPVWGDWVIQDDQNKYKYTIDVDGNGWSGRFFRLMSTGTMVMKSTIFPEWYADHIQPWVHYVPVSTDYTDLWRIMAFFRGDRDAKGNHDHLAKEIGYAGKYWAENHMRIVDMQVYMYRLLLEYNRIMNRD
ncbi:hypothetical protein T439DRAFT_330273 [Meredithblackwellia eburnea MCA 4105]